MSERDTIRDLSDVECNQVSGGTLPIANPNLPPMHGPVFTTPPLHGPVFPTPPLHETPQPFPPSGLKGPVGPQPGPLPIGPFPIG
jgi:hypothetical protein